jgi:phosphatidylinositol-3-phosphatase
VRSTNSGARRCLFCARPPLVYVARIVAVVAAATAFALLPAGAPAASASLVAAYSFNEGSGTVVGDSSGNGRTGTVSNGTWSASGKYGSALVFNGTSSVVTVADATSLHLTSAMTIEAWVDPSTVTSAWRDVIYKGNDNYYLEGTSCCASGGPAAGGTFGALDDDVEGPSRLTANVWTHLAETYDGATVRLFVNGVQVASKAESGLLATSSNPLQIGGDSLYGQWFSGLIDEVRVYNTALSAAQIQTDMNTPISADSTPPSAPGTLSGSVVSGGEIDLSWGAATDNVGVTGYQLERCQGAGCSSFAQIATPSGTSYNNTTGLLPNTSYSYRVRATDAAGNLGPYSNTFTAITLAGQANTDCGTKTGPPATYAHVIWIWMENHPYNQIIGSTSAPYTNTLAQHCGLATNYFAITHPSLPNYIAATSGSTWGITDDGAPSTHPLAVPSIFQQAPSAGSYEESMPTNCDLTDAYPYASWHNPELYYTNISAACGVDNVPMGTTSSGAFLNAVNAGTLPAFTFITPNLCDDTHDCSIQTGDSWLQSWVPKIIAGPSYQAGNTVIFITYDEDDTLGTNQVATLVVSPYTAPGTQSGVQYTHYSLLRTAEELLGITTYLGNAATAPSMRSAFGL